MTEIEPGPGYIGRIIHEFTMPDLVELGQRYLRELGMEIRDHKVVELEESQGNPDTDPVIRFTVVPMARQPQFAVNEMPVAQLSEPAAIPAETEAPEKANPKADRSQRIKEGWALRRARIEAAKAEPVHNYQQHSEHVPAVGHSHLFQICIDCGDLKELTCQVCEQKAHPIEPVEVKQEVLAGHEAGPFRG